MRSSDSAPFNGSPPPLPLPPSARLLFWTERRERDSDCVSALISMCDSWQRCCCLLLAVFGCSPSSVVAAVCFCCMLGAPFLPQHQKCFVSTIKNVSNRLVSLFLLLLCLLSNSTKPLSKRQQQHQPKSTPATPAALTQWHHQHRHPHPHLVLPMPMPMSTTDLMSLALCAAWWSTLASARRTQCQI